MIGFPDLPRVCLAHLPTPLEPMAALQRAVNARTRLFVKRDDCTGLAFGGNKTRKLEFAMADAQTKGATVIITCGGMQSNHVRQTAAAAAKLGMAFHAVLADPLAGVARGFASARKETGNRLLDAVLGARFHTADNIYEAADRSMTDIAEKLSNSGETPYTVTLGASDGIGSMGYVHAARELLGQCKEQSISPSHVVLGTGSAGTHGGLLAGLRACGSAMKVIGVSVSETAEIKRAKVRSVLDQIAALWGAGAPDIPDEDVVVYDDYTGPGYAIPSSAGMDAITLVARREAILLDPVYTGKAMSGFLDLVQNGPLRDGRDVVFLHTGGAPAIFAYPELGAGQPTDENAYKRRRARCT